MPDPSIDLIAHNSPNPRVKWVRAIVEIHAFVVVIRIILDH